MRTVAFSVFFALTLFVNLQIQAQENISQEYLKDFETDGCTLFIEGPSSKPDLWAHCCFEHDLRYWFGGTMDDKHFADLELRSCVKKVAGSFWANLIYTGVKFGHLSPIKFKYIWSWGWDPERQRVPLTEEEIHYVIEKLYALDLDPNFREMFIRKYLVPN